MPYSPLSKVLFVSICSLTKAGGDDHEYDGGEAIASGLAPRLAGKLLRRRERVRNLVRETSEATWQGVALPELEYNRRLEWGPDFGGGCTARYRPAVERYDGRFFLGLGVDRADALRASRHHLLLLSGLYGVLRPFEPIQLYRAAPWPPAWPGPGARAACSRMSLTAMWWRGVSNGSST